MRRSFDQVRAEGAGCERRAMVRYMRDRAASAERALRRSPHCTDEEARVLRDRIEALTDEIEQGLHR